MKNTIVKILGIVLAASCVLSIAGAWGTVGNVADAKDYWEKVADAGHEKFAMMLDGINQLRSNQATYTDGVKEYEAGLKDYIDGKATVDAGEKTLADSQKQYDAGAKQLADGHKEYEAGLKELQSGKEELEEGKKTLQEGLAALEAGKQAYAEGLAAYEEGLKAYAANEAMLKAGEAELAAKRPEYEAGLKKLKQVEPIYNACQGILANIAEKEAQYEEAAEAGNLLRAKIYGDDINRLKNSLKTELMGYSIEGIIKEYEDGKAQIKLFEDNEAKIKAGYEELAKAAVTLREARAQLDLAEIDIANGEKEIAAGRATVAEGEKKVADGEKELSDAKALLDENDAKIIDAAKQISDGKVQLEEGKKALAEGEISLAEGKKLLAQYEDGQLQLVDGLDEAIEQDTFYNTSGEKLLPGIAERLGDYFTYWTINESGETVKINDNLFLDLDKAQQVHTAGIAFMDDCEANVTKELVSRMIPVICAALTALAGIAAVVFAFMSKRKLTLGFGVSAAAAALIGLITALVMGAENPYSVIAGCNTALSMVNILIPMAVIAAAFTAYCFISKSDNEPKKAAK